MSNKVCAFYSLLLTQIAKLNRFIVNEIFNLNYVSNKLKFNDITEGVFFLLFLCDIFSNFYFCKKFSFKKKALK